MGSDNLINFHKWQKWQNIFNEISIVIFKRHGYNSLALKSITSKKFTTSKIRSLILNKKNFKKLPSWTWVNNKEIKISSSEIRKQRNLLRGQIINNQIKNLPEAIKNILDDSKAEEIEVIDIKKKTSFADYFIIATCRSSTHANAIADELTKKLKKQGIKCPSPEGRPQCDWVIVDADSVIVHLFKYEIRKLYNLEKLWDISFDSVENKLA